MKFEEALQESPDDVAALYELSYPLMVSTDCKRSLEIATGGAEYDSRLLPEYYSVIGSDLDELAPKCQAETR